MLYISKAWKKRLSARAVEQVHPESFVEARKRLRWSPEQAADFLWVSGRTVRNWEAGIGRIPYPAFKLLRLRSGHAVASIGWDGWMFAANGALLSPAGRSFMAYELEQIERVFAQARLWRQGMASALRSGADATPINNMGGNRQCMCKEEKPP
jgi:DNA-binding transcriptional regulator YiaG